MATFKEIPALTTQQMVEVDRLMIEVYGIELIQMMENAGRSLAELARQELGGKVSGKLISVMCGAGNNGGGGLVAARHLHNWGAKVSLHLTTTPAHFKRVPALQWQILTKFGLDYNQRPARLNGDLIIDALIGYGLSGNPRQPAAAWIERANQSGIPVLALDIPSGLDASSGIPGDPCIKAAATLTLALPKSGLVSRAARGFVGDLYLADISVPPELYLRLGIRVPNLFENGQILKII